MNERIVKLFMQSVDTNYIPLPIEDHIPSWTEKFAELLIMECINEVEGLQVSDWNQHWNRAIAHIALHLKQHFGIEQ